ncbi:MAG TPA: hypothetical protein VI942_07050 [Thermoanaerobaculia bacterium]|nr:hypothetical protein [Thermoanaerobaculia bacterium]
MRAPTRFLPPLLLALPALLATAPARADLVIGAPRLDREGGLADVGGEMVLYGALFADGFEIGSTQRW